MSFSKSSFAAWLGFIESDNAACNAWEALAHFLYPLWVQVQVTNNDYKLLDEILAAVFNPRFGPPGITLCIRELMFIDWTIEEETPRQVLLHAVHYDSLVLGHLQIHMKRRLVLMEEHMLSLAEDE